jgi:hypothetical protein
MTLRKRTTPNVKIESLYKLSEVQVARKKKLKPSPYHNYQKHLTTALRHMLSPPTLSSSSTNIAHIALALWNVFINDQHSTKKILHFILNEEVEHQWSEEELR